MSQQISQSVDIVSLRNKISELIFEHKENMQENTYKTLYEQLAHECTHGTRTCRAVCTQTETDDERNPDPFIGLLVEPFGVEPFRANGNLPDGFDIRNQIMRKAMKAGFQQVDASGSRCFYEDGNLAKLEAIARCVTKRYPGYYATVRRMEYPGLGLSLPEDFLFMNI